MKILCVSNCNVLGLKASLSYFFKESLIDEFLIQRYHEKSEEIKKNIDEYDLVIAPEVINNELKSLSDEHIFVDFNPIIFHAFHPDQCYLFYENNPLNGVMGDYHSLAAFCAYKNNLSIEDAEILFSKTYTDNKILKLCWSRSLINFNQSQADIFSDLMLFLRSSASKEPFMHTLNHPKIYAIHIALQLKLLNKKLIRKISTDLPIFDSLSNSVIWPIEKEVADFYKFKSYNHSYKVSEESKYFDRKIMIEKSFKLYEQLDNRIEDIKIRGNLIFDKVEKRINNESI